MRRFLVLLWLLSLALAAPRLVVEPEDGVKPLLDLIASAREEILVKMYLWTPSRMDVVEALGEAARRGVRVRVLLEREPSGGRVDLEVFQALKARGWRSGSPRPSASSSCTKKAWWWTASGPGWAP